MDEDNAVARIDHDATSTPATIDHDAHATHVQSGATDITIVMPQQLVGDNVAMSLYNVMCRTLMEPGLSRRNIDDRLLNNIAMFPRDAVQRVARSLFDGVTLSREGIDGVAVRRLSSAAATKEGAMALLHIWAELTLGGLQRARRKEVRSRTMAKARDYAAPAE